MLPCYPQPWHGLTAPGAAAAERPDIGGREGIPQPETLRAFTLILSTAVPGAKPRTWRCGWGSEPPLMHDSLPPGEPAPMAERRFNRARLLEGTEVQTRGGVDKDHAGGGGVTE